MTARLDIMTAHVSVARSQGAGSAVMLDEPTFQALYAGTAAPLRAYVTRVLGDRSEADDILQDAYLRLLRQPVPTTDLDELRRYLFRVTGNLMTDRWRARRHDRAAAAGEPADTPVDGRDTAERMDVARVFRHLRLQDRKLMWLAHVEGADHREIAGALGLRPASVRVLLWRARRRFAQLLRDAGRERGARR